MKEEVEKAHERGHGERGEDADIYRIHNEYKTWAHVVGAWRGLMPSDVGRNGRRNSNSMSGDRVMVSKVSKLEALRP